MPGEKMNPEQQCQYCEEFEVDPINSNYGRCVSMQYHLHDEFGVAACVTVNGSVDNTCPHFDGNDEWDEWVKEYNTPLAKLYEVDYWY